MKENYPVLGIMEEVKRKLREHKIAIVLAPPGAGKSTLLPLQLLNEEWLAGKKMIMLEPRRLAARSVALRMSDLRKEKAGETVGYRIRFESNVSEKTKIEVVTEGIFLRQIQSDSTLSGVGLVIFDEFHERSLQADLALALSLQVQHLLRDDLRILLMSATLDTELISAQLGNAPVITSLGKQYPVSITYAASAESTPVVSLVSKAIRATWKEQQGDVLVFLPGAGEIHRVASILQEENFPASIHPLYGDLPFKKQQDAILPRADGLRKIVLTTSIAETSLTIEGITTVIDCGYARVPKFDPRSGLSRLATIRVTRDAADQRAGRAGRLGPGTCYRLWTEGEHRNLLSTRQPEILEADLCPLMLELANWGVQDVKSLKWITAPPAGAMKQAKDLLQELGSVDREFRITPRGKEMVKLPTHPRIAHMLLAAPEGKSGTRSLATDIAAVLEERDPLPKQSGVDLSLRLSALRRFRSGERVNADTQVLERMERLAASWRKILKIQVDNSVPDDADVGKLLSEAYPERIARQLEKHSVRYKLTNGRVAKLPENDPLRQETWLAIAEVDSGSGEGKIFLAAPMNEKDLVDRSEEKEVVKWDADKGHLSAFLEKQIEGTVLSRKPLEKISDELRIQVLCKAFREEGFKLLDWNETHDQWQARVLSLRRWRPDEEWPDVSEKNLIATPESWLATYLLGVSNRQDFYRLDISTILSGLLPWDMGNRLDKLAPARMPVPSGSMIKLTYAADGPPPVMEVRLQEVFGLLETPAVNEGKTKMVMHLLSPGYKPVQVTQDLKSFWNTTYHVVRKELRMRYPKHHWPEDPWTAQAVRGVLKKRS